MTGGTRITVAVPTYRRPGALAALLPLLIDQIAGLTQDDEADILVVDNDPHRSGETVVGTFVDAAAGPGPLVRYVAQPVPGIAATRARALAECRDRDVLQFIDDDELPVDDWLARMIAAWREFGRPAAVAGRVLPRFAAPLDPWLEAGGFFDRRVHRRGALLPVAPAGNLLLDLNQIRALGVSFDASLGLLGGEDTLFTTQLTASGGQIRFCDDAAIVDVVPPERATRAWVLRRARLHGGVHADVRLRTSRGAQRAGRRCVLLVGGVARVAAGATRSAWGRLVHDLERDARGRRALHRGLGIASGALGQVRAEYDRPEGEHR